MSKISGSGLIQKGSGLIQKGSGLIQKNVQIQKVRKYLLLRARPDPSYLRKYLLLRARPDPSLW